MKLSIIILSFNTKELLDRCLSSVYSSLASAAFEYEVLVIDNNSSDGSPAYIKKKYPQVELIEKKENLGYGKANNLGIKKAKGEYILLLNSDCKVLEQGIQTLIDFASSHKKSFIGGKLYNEDRTDQASCGPFYTVSVVFTMLFLKGDQMNITRYSPKENRQVDWVSGACILAQKSYFEDIGGFDEEIFMYMEEIDLLYRAKKKGYAVWFCAHAPFIHTGAASSENKREPVVNIYRGLSYFYEKHYTAFEKMLLHGMLRLKAWLVRIICGIIGDQDLSVLYAKALDVLT